VSLSALLTAVNEYVADALVNDCGVAAPTRQLSYHGRIPFDQCCPDGFLSTSWSDGNANGQQPCAGMPTYNIEVRYVVCWSVPEGDAGGIVLTPEQDATWNNDALMLADVADCVGRSLVRLTCDRQSTDPLDMGVLTQAGQLSYLGVSPIVPLGGCAGVLWRLSAPVRSGPVIS
jgi:hypothetical protein